MGEFTREDYECGKIKSENLIELKYYDDPIDLPSIRTTLDVPIDPQKHAEFIEPIELFKSCFVKKTSTFPKEQLKPLDSLERKRCMDLLQDLDALIKNNVNPTILSCVLDLLIELDKENIPPHHRLSAFSTNKVDLEWYNPLIIVSIIKQEDNIPLSTGKLVILPNASRKNRIMPIYKNKLFQLILFSPNLVICPIDYP